MLNLDTASLLTTTKLKGHYIVRMNIRYKDDPMFKYINDAYDIKPYYVEYHISDHIAVCDLYFLGWLYQNYKFTAEDIQDGFYQNIANIPVTKTLNKLFPDLCIDESMEYAFKSQSLYAIKWVYMNFQDILSYLDIVDHYCGDIIDVLNCFNDILPILCDCDNAYNAICRDDLIYIMWHCNVTEDLNIYDLIKCAAGCDCVKILRWLHETYKFCDSSIMIEATEFNCTDCIKWLTKNCSICTGYLEDLGDYSADVEYYNRRYKPK